MQTAASSAHSKKETMTKWAAHPLSNRDSTQAWLLDRQAAFNHQFPGAGRITGTGGSLSQHPSIATPEDQQAIRASTDARDVVDVVSWTGGFNRPSPSVSVTSETRQNKGTGSRDQQDNQDLNTVNIPQGSKARLLASQNHKTYF